MIHLKSQQFVSAENNSTKKEKYSSTNTTEEEIQKICNDIQNGFVVQKLHQNENLTLGDFSSKINYSRHQVTEAISIGLQTNFYDLVNKYRINTFIEILKKSPNQNITDVFYESGFKSKATFYKYFKKYQNMSPKAFKDSLTS
ncbi:helix-turn-helix domain-containing protein [Joostella sp. CR20]|uniref:helix-turn-helix domain-containing protein n=1 Tax=Joostella sp. CR20 TaxID=2804312 RepID=UPI00313D09F5